MEYSVQRIVSDINLVSRFLAAPQTALPSENRAFDCIVIAPSAVLYGAESIFRQLQSSCLKTKTLILCGGIGHSTSLIYDAVARSPAYAEIANSVQGLPEGRVLETLFHYAYDSHIIQNAGCQILVEDKSTNCGANAAESRKVLEHFGVPTPRTLMVVQDPTMQLRTIASFEKVYSDMEDPPSLHSYPVFVPKVKQVDQLTDLGQHTDVLRSIQFDVPEVPDEQLWEMKRFMELIMGEIPRVKDDENGYGPNGKAFISHVDLPEHIELAWSRLRQHLVTSR